MEMHEPLTPEDCDLRDFTFMPIDIIRLFNSRFNAIANDSEWRAGVTLWLKSWQQMPAGSLPNDDIELCRLAELGRDLKKWRKVKNMALHGWILCSDGRLYHPVVAEKANEAWAKRLNHKERSRKANAKRWGYEQSNKESNKDASRTPTSIIQASNKHPLRTPSSILQGIQQASLNDPKGEGEGEGERDINETANAVSNAHARAHTEDPPPKASRSRASIDVAGMQAELPGLSAEVARDYLAFRKSLKAALTPSAWKSIAAEVKASGVSPDAAMAEAMAAGWRGFKAEWLHNRRHANNHTPRVARIAQPDPDASARFAASIIAKERIIEGNKA